MKFAILSALAGFAIFVAFAQAPVPAPAPSAAQSADFFENKVRPILANNCYACHTDGEMGGLRVDSRERLLKGGGSGPAIVPGNPDKSLLIQAVRQTGDLKMPQGGKLKPEEVQTLVEWVKAGAPWPETKAAVVKASTGRVITPEQRAFWSFQPLKEPAIPAVKEKSWAKTNIDRFVLAKLESKDMKPVSTADRKTLIRRVTLDLIGLPPTPEEVDAFVADKSPNAYEKVVDRLLASPRYGERWGRHWLDVARYSEDDVRGLDPKGRGYMPFEGAYVYRDWVIKAFNNDMPYGEFIKAQLAGDLLPEPLRDKDIAGTGILGEGPWWWDQAEPVQGRADERNERIDMVTRGMLGLTVACARCHDHKYDPITQKDYYSLAAIFLNTTYHQYPSSSPADMALWEQQQKVIDDKEDVLDDFMKTQSKLYSEMLAQKTSKYMVAAWQVTGEPKKKVSEAAADQKVDPELLDRWIKFLAKPPKHYSYLKDWQDMVKCGGTLDQAQFLADNFQKLVLSVMRDEKDLEEENDIIKAKAGVRKKPRRDAYPNEFETQDQFCPGCDLELKTMPIEPTNLYLDMFAKDLDSESDERPEPGLLSLRGWDLERHFSAEVTEHVAALRAEIDALKKAQVPYPFLHGAMDKKTMGTMHVNVRGNPHTLGDQVSPRFLAILSPSTPKPFTDGSGRLDLADDIVASPIASRVIVNRIWRWHFGSGIVETPDNFGKTGDPPSDPELLEYLANDFVKNGMSIKKLQREIVMSSVYQLSTDANAENAEKDGANRLYWRFNRQRLDAEAIRDSVLFAAGDLDLKKVGGPSTDFSDDNHRRTVYCKVSRYRLNNFLQVFDFPNPSFTAEQRFVTIVPLQRLFFMNSSFVYKQAQVFAKRIYDEGSDAARIEKAYRVLFGRAPSEAETKAGLDFLQSHPETPGNQVAGEPTTAWNEYARVLLSSNEFEFVN
ncbi:MAG TPA: PSD1 and planctomycete cytochrome C domain-containing protein [Bryobacteraceae bacterium]|nr:PSD1 and planctomycete cytochrome C domain-containing protein [Bryobacteraceae bacterium]